MAQIHGQIDSLKQIRKNLNLKGIDRFNSINQINNFLENYKSEEMLIHKHFENELEKDIIKLKERIEHNQEALKKIKNESIEKLDAEISLNLNRIDKYKNNTSFLAKIFNHFTVKLLDKKVKYLQNNYAEIISKSTIEIENNIKTDHGILNEFINNKEAVISARSVKETKQLAYTKEVVSELNPLIAGAIGENLVVKEIKKLSDDYILINDFSLDFRPPLYNKKDNDRIYSIQIDHLLISKSGVFILETKNWSKKSIKSLDLRSPIEQINRTSFALFVLLNSNKKHNEIRLSRHHWGIKQIPIRSLIVMINQKPKENFKYVKIKTLKELNSYLTYFEPVFSDTEVKSIANYFIDIKE